jgi:hypothetical protein
MKVKQGGLSFATACGTALVMLLLVHWAAIAQAQEWAPERRRDQFPTEPAYLAVPFPYSLPGIGQGIAFTGLLANIAETPVDAAGVFITGDIEGDYIQVGDLFVVPNTLFFEFERFRASSGIINNYEKRGMDTDKNDFNLIEFDKYDGRNARGVLTFLDRRLAFRAGIQITDSRIVRIRDSDAKVIADLRGNPIEAHSDTTFAGFVGDFTDDRQDPRIGFRVDLQRSHTPRDTKKDADFYVWEYSATGYFPVGQLSTWLVHYFASDAQVITEGETDPDKVRADLGVDCTASARKCAAAAEELVNRNIAAHKYGTASALGGDTRLRSYPNGRYQGAHAVFYATEFRWNISDEVTPFDYFIWKDVRTGVQAAFFYETGSVADKRSGLGAIYRSSYGAGFRLISASGLVYRADLSTGDEGGSFVLIFNYPF